MNFLACDGDWIVGGGGISCDGTLITITSQEISEEVRSAYSLSTEDAGQLLDATILLFAAVFSFLILRKVL